MRPVASVRGPKDIAPRVPPGCSNDYAAQHSRSEEIPSRGQMQSRPNEGTLPLAPFDERGAQAIVNRGSVNSGPIGGGRRASTRRDPGKDLPSLKVL